ncbi:hypothetical protein O6H91_11G058700 [Diphasiastrum complanatum]|uniref:Uncharacterized protein n=1 Tax=Diphasiastrum complanatum TaxID=34168 RepID=A0ACC2C9G2_DIPCM|nr:hypothetical protein O6H91_11G058700 [Diphasiastrum complanatum]
MSSRSMKAMKRLAAPALVSSLNLDKEELVIDIDGITITQPVLQHVGISTWPGRLTLTDRGLYFEKVGAVSYDKPKKFDLSVDLKHVIKPDWTGPWGLRLFDKAILYKSDAMQEPISFEFPELRCHARRDYWLNIIREVALAHNFVRKFHLGGAHQTEVQAKAVLGIVRLCATRALVHLLPLRPELLLTFSLANQLPGGDLVLEALADRICKGELGALVVRDEVDVKHQAAAGPVIASFSGSNKPLSGAFVSKEEGIPIGEVLVGNMNNLEKAILNSRIYSKKVEVAQTTIEGVKLDDLGKKLAAMKGLLEPLIACGLRLQGIAAWKDPYQTITFLLVSTYIIYRNWLGYVLPTMLALCVGYVLRSRHFRRASKLHEIVVPPPPKQSAIEQLSDLQRTFTQLEGSIQTANITLLKLYTLFINELPEATDQAIWIISGLAVGLAWIPFRIIFLVLFLDFFTRQHNLRRESTERFIQRLREWWHSIPVVPIRFAEPKCKTQ